MVAALLPSDHHVLALLCRNVHTRRRRHTGDLSCQLLRSVLPSLPRTSKALLPRLVIEGKLTARPAALAPSRSEPTPPRVCQKVTEEENYQSNLLSSPLTLGKSPVLPMCQYHNQPRPTCASQASLSSRSCAVQQSLPRNQSCSTKGHT